MGVGDLAQRTGISRATLSRLERYELSPSAAMLATLCGQYGWTLSRLMVEAEQTTASVITAEEQVTWRDHDTGYIRRVASPPHPKSQAKLIEVTIPAGASVSYDSSCLKGLEHHLRMIEGALSIDLGGRADRPLSEKRSKISSDRYPQSFVVRPDSS